MCLSCGRSRHSWKNKERGQGRSSGGRLTLPKLEDGQLSMVKVLGSDLEVGKRLVGD